MSYTIVYDRQFLKLEDGRIIPMTLLGSSNCWERDSDGKERRERYWTSFWEQTVPAYTQDELMQKAEEYCGGGEYQEHFKRGGKWVDDAAFLRFFRNGIAQAKTMQELADEHIHTPPIWASLSIWTKIPGGKEWDSRHTTECSRYLHSDDEVVAFLSIAGERLKHKTDDETVYVCLKYYGSFPLPKPERIFKPKELLTDGFYVVTFGAGRYVMKVTKGFLHHVPYVSAAKRFRSEQDAERWIKQRNLENRFTGDFKVEKAA